MLPDSNALFGRLVGTRPDQDLLAVLELSANGEAQVVLPEIVQWEIANQAQREIAEQITRYRAAGARLRRLEIEVPAFNEGPSLGKERVALATEELRKKICLAAAASPHPKCFPCRAGQTISRPSPSIRHRRPWIHGCTSLAYRARTASRTPLCRAGFKRQGGLRGRWQDEAAPP